MTEGFVDDEQGRFRAGRGCVDQIFTLKHKVREHGRKNVECMRVLQTWRENIIGSIGRHYVKY